MGKRLLGEVVASLEITTCNFSTSPGDAFSPESTISFGNLSVLQCGSTCIFVSVFWSTTVLFFIDKSTSALLEATVLALPLPIYRLSHPSDISDHHGVSFQPSSFQTCAGEALPEKP